MKNTYQFKISTNCLNNIVQVKNLLTTFSSMAPKIISLPKKLKRFVVIKSPHINQASKEHFQIITYRRIFFVNLTTVELKNFLLKMPNNLSLKIKKIENLNNI